MNDIFEVYELVLETKPAVLPMLLVQRPPSKTSNHPLENEHAVRNQNMNTNPRDKNYQMMNLYVLDCEHL